jgi:transposase
MTMVVGFDVHRSQITYDALDTATGEVQRGRIMPATREGLREWLSRFDGQTAKFAVEAATGWRFCVEELQAKGHEVYLAEVAETRALRGRKRRAKTDRADARWLRTLLARDELPEAWIPPREIQELRTRVRLRQSLVSERSAWLHRVSSTIFHQGARLQNPLTKEKGRSEAEGLELSPAARELIGIALAMVRSLDQQIEPLEQELRAYANGQPACQALQGHFGIGPVLAVVIFAEIGDARRFSSSRKLVRLSGLDITVYESADKRQAGRISRQGAPLLRWAMVEAAQTATRHTSPDRGDYLKLKARLGHNRAAIEIARRMLRRCHHTLISLGEEALAPPAA